MEPSAQTSAHVPSAGPRGSLSASTEQLLDSAPDGVVIIDDAGIIRLVNRQAEVLFGYRREELVGELVEVLVPERVRLAHPARRGGYVHDPTTRPMGAGLELTARRKDGSEFAVDISLSSLETDEGVLVSAAVRDITDRKRIEATFQALLEAAPDAMVAVDDAGVLRLVNRQAETMFGYARAELLGQNVDMLVADHIRQVHPKRRASYFTNPMARPMGAGLALAARRKDGSEFPVDISLSALETEDGTLVSAAVRDITDRKTIEAQFHPSLSASAYWDCCGPLVRLLPDRHTEHAMRLRQLTALLEDSPDATVFVDVLGQITEWNPAAETMFGWVRGEILDTPMRSYVPPDGLRTFEAAWKQLEAGVKLTSFEADRLHRDGTRVAVSVHAIAVLNDAGFAGTIATYRPQGHFDPALHDADDVSVSGLPCRRALQAALTAPLPTGMNRGVAILDVDAFALVNQTYGPDVGDEVLRQLGRRLDLGGSNCVTGHWQADEFVYVLDAHDAHDALEMLIQAARHSVHAPLAVGERSLNLSVSAGLVTSEHTGISDLFRAASQALQAAKAGGRDQAVWFDPAEHTPASGDLHLASDLRRGIDTGELRLLYQPIVELTNHDLVGVEALVRWQRSDGRLMAPAEFIDVAERTGQIVSLGAWVTAQACQSALRLSQLESAPHSVSINVSARQLSDPGVVEMLRDALVGSGCSPANVIIEVTETAFIPDMPRAVATLHAIKALGVALALDDFGTGYSSLLYLKRFPVDRIKIDRSFVRGLGTDADDTAIVASTISLAHSVGVLAVAEGVETVDQLTLLRQMGCDFAQGYLFSRPLTLGQLQQWLRAHPPARRSRARSAVPPVYAPETNYILRLHREGASLHTIAAALNVEGSRTSLARRWSPQSVAKCITQAECPTIVLAD